MIAPLSAGEDEGTSAEADPQLSERAVVAIDVGNRTIRLGAWEAMKVVGSAGVATEDRDRFSNAFDALCGRFRGGQPRAVVVASVVPSALGWIRDRVATASDLRASVVGQGVPLPAQMAVRQPDQVGVDRVCAAAAAFERTQHACTVIDFGTAVTVDLVDDQGLFVGGAILPGPALQAAALASGTAALPDVELASPEQPVGRDTVEAIRSGIFNGIAGAVRGLVEQYATVLGTWPQVVATGGDLERFLSRCDFIDTAVPELTLMGIGLAYAKHHPASGQ